LLDRILHQDYTIVRSGQFLSLADIIALRPNMILLDHGLMGSDPDGFVYRPEIQCCLPAYSTDTAVTASLYSHYCQDVPGRCLY
jgi:hypothetical protein